MTTPELLKDIDETIRAYEVSQVLTYWQQWEANRLRQIARRKAS